MTPEVDPQLLSAYRQKTFRTDPGLHLRNIDQAVNFINERKTVLFWPAREIEFPSLWSGVAGDRPVPDNHDDPGHVTWGWKDALLDQKRVYYGRVIRKRNTFISLDFLPNFYALSPNFGSPEEDYLIDYEAGKLTAEAKTVYETLLKEGPLDTVALRRAAHLTSQASNGPFNKALEVLQTSFRILPTGVAQAGAWNYAFIYEALHRYYPWVVEQAHPITEWDARRSLVMMVLESTGALPVKGLLKVLGWPPEILNKALARLVETSQLIECKIPDVNGMALTLPVLLR